jgi:hypothetical protein
VRERERERERERGRNHKAIDIIESRRKKEGLACLGL